MKNSAAKVRASTDRVPSAVLCARFRHHYPDPSLWRSADYRTRDRLIPFGLFWIYYRAMESTHAYERVQMANAVANAIGLALFAKNGNLPPALVSDVRNAFLPS